MVSVIGTSSKMVSMLYREPAQNIVQFEPYEFVQISPACGPNAYQKMYGEIKGFQFQHSNGKIKYPIGNQVLQKSCR